MTDLADEPRGATPVKDVSGLLLPISTRPEFVDAESTNIIEADGWIRNQRSRIDGVFGLDFYRELHRRMFDQVWSWAGVRRKHDVLPVGVPWQQVEVSLLNAGEDFKLRFLKETGVIRLMAEYHHRLVLIHPFTDGNGRWSRLAADAVALRTLKVGSLVWSVGDITQDGDERDSYLAALREADVGNIQPLVGYLEERNR